jgi:hypothetical protein
LTKVARVSRYAARAMMTDMLEREPPPWLPPSWRLILTEDGGIALRTPDRDIPGERILMRYRRLGESSTHHQPDEGLRGTPATPPAPAAPSEASTELASKEGRAVDWLSAKLVMKRNTLKRAVAQRACLRFFGVKEHAFRTRVWSKARENASLDPVAPAGRKRKTRRS